MGRSERTLAFGTRGERPVRARRRAVRHVRQVRLLARDAGGGRDHLIAFPLLGQRTLNEMGPVAPRGVMRAGHAAHGDSAAEAPREGVSVPWRAFALREGA